MSPRAKRIIEVLMRDCGRTFADELGIRLDANDPATLFRLLCACLLFSTRISHTIAMKAARVLFARGWTTPQKLAASTWGQRVGALDEAGYVRYDERTSTMLGEMAQLLLDLYDGDLGTLREKAGRQPHRERELLKEFRGIGDVAVDIFFREIQVTWPEIFPYVDRKAAESAAKFGLKADLKTLAGLKTRDEFARLVAGLVRVQLTHRHDQILKDAGRSAALRTGGQP
jgi:hypothetical protein